MILTLLLILILTLSGSVLTCLYSDKDSLLVRLGAGNIIGAVLFGLVAFILACVVGLSPAIVLTSFAVALLPLALLAKKNLRRRFISDFKSAPGLISKNAFSTGYYIAFLLLFYLFFERAMLETPQGIFTGGSQNLGDLPFHLGAIFSFSEGNNFPPENPSYAFAKFTYPFMTDFIVSCFVTLGVKVRDAMLWQSVTLAFSLLVLFENFAFHLTKKRLAGKLAPVILLFCGGLGFIIFFRDYWNDGRGIFEFLWNLKDDYTIRSKGIRFGNSLVTLFMTQRGFLLGMPLMLIILVYLWKLFTAESKGEINRDRQDERNTQDELDKGALSTQHSALSTIVVGLIAGTLPLIHVHSLAVLFLVCAFLFFFSLSKWRLWMCFAITVAAVAIPELLWIMTGSATRLKEFIDWNFGWDARGESIFIFWAKNLGFFIPLLILGIYFLMSASTIKNKEPDELENKDQRPKIEAHSIRLLIFYLPFLFVFIIANLVKLAPWEWDNIKVLIYWYIASVPFVAWLLAEFWEKGAGFKVVAGVCLFFLTLSGALDIWRVVSRQINYQVFSRDAVSIAEQIKQKTPPNALFLNAPTYNSAVVLSGRRSLMRYSGHLSSYGIDYVPREREVKRIYEGSGLADSLLKNNNIEYVLISPEEFSNLTVNEDYFSKYLLIAEAGEYRVYQIKK